MNHPACQLLPAKPVAERILARCRVRAREFAQRAGRPAGFAVVLVGGDALARSFLERKRRACEELGLRPVLLDLPATTRTEELIRRLRELGDEEAVDGILLQYPLPDHVDERRAGQAIPAGKDIDCANAVHRPAIGLDERHPPLAPPVEGKRQQLPSSEGPGEDVVSFGSPAAVEGARLLLEEYGITVAGKTALVIGCGAMLAEPFLAMLLAERATGTRVDADVPGLPGQVARADIVVAAVGRARFVRGEWLKPGAVVIDAGLNPGPVGPVGDVDAESARERAGYLTPVPGGIGTITLAVLVERTVAAAERRPTG